MSYKMCKFFNEINITLIKHTYILDGSEVSLL